MSKNKRTKYTKKKEETLNSQDSLEISNCFNVNFLSQKTNRDTESNFFEENDEKYHFAKEASQPNHKRKKKSVTFNQEKIINNCNTESSIAIKSNKMLINNSPNQTSYENYLDISVDDSNSSEGINTNIIEDQVDIGENTLNNIERKTKTRYKKVSNKIKFFKDMDFNLNDEFNEDSNSKILSDNENINSITKNNISNKSNDLNDHKSNSKTQLLKNIEDFSEILKSDKKKIATFLNGKLNYL
jgi:hypothetical protein